MKEKVLLHYRKIVLFIAQGDGDLVRGILKICNNSMPDQKQATFKIKELIYILAVPGGSISLLRIYSPLMPIILLYVPLSNPPPICMYNQSGDVLPAYSLVPWEPNAIAFVSNVCCPNWKTKHIIMNSSKNEIWGGKYSPGTNLLLSYV